MTYNRCHCLSPSIYGLHCRRQSINLFRMHSMQSLIEFIWILWNHFLSSSNETILIISVDLTTAWRCSISGTLSLNYTWSVCSPTRRRNKVEAKINWIISQLTCHVEHFWRDFFPFEGENLQRKKMWVCVANAKKMNEHVSVWLTSTRSKTKWSKQTQLLGTTKRKTELIFLHVSESRACDILGDV